LLWLLSSGVLEQGCGTDQAADVGRQDAIGATSHELWVFGSANFGSTCEII